MTERALLRVGAGAQALRCRSRGDREEREPVVAHASGLRLLGADLSAIPFPLKGEHWKMWLWEEGKGLTPSASSSLTTVHTVCDS